MELRLAAMDTQGDRAKAAQRKAHIVHGSNTGLPGSRPAAVQVSAVLCRSVVLHAGGGTVVRGSVF
eukprot:1128459-Pelagomonas_calceolata.AAC.1